MSYNSNNYDVIESKNVEVYEVCKVTKYARIWKTGEDMIKLNTSGMRLFSSMKDSACDYGVQILVTVRYQSFTLTPETSPAITPDIPIIYEIHN